ncbi:hypothetical protein ACF0H5_005116 [Mactra antiquata]
MDPKQNPYRFIILLFDCLLTFGTYFCFDMPSVLQDQLTCPVCTTTVYNNASDICNATDCLGINDDNYNLFYAIFAWTNAVVVIGAGFLIDKFGNIVGAVLFSFLCLAGTSVFAVGAMLKGTPAMYPVMLLGRLLFGSGNGAISIVQFRIGAYWFKNKELAFAFGVMLTVSRMGSVLNFFFTDHFRNVYGLTWTLWGGAALCGVSFLSAIIVSSLDMYGVKQLGNVEQVKTASKEMRLKDIRKFSLSYWMLLLTILFSYSSIIPFIADSSKFINLRYNLTPERSAYISSAVYDVPMVISPFLGLFVDKFGCRGFLLILSTISIIPVFGLLAFTLIHPLITTVWLGFSYSLIAASSWSAIPFVVRQSNLGIAIGVTNSLQMIGIGFSNLVVGSILGKSQGLTADETLLRWKYVMVFLLASTVVAVITSLLLNIVDRKRGGIVNMGRQERLYIQEVLTYGDERSIPNDEKSPLLNDKHSTIN